MSLKRKRTSLAKQVPPPEPKSPSPPPWNLPFPRLPTVDEAPPVNADLKSVSESGVLATALLQSRELWVQGYHFPKVWKPTRRGRKDPPPTSQYITTRLGICPVVIGPHIFPDTRFLSVRKVDEKAEKAAKVAAPPPPAPAPSTPTTSNSNTLTVKALTEIAATSPEFSAILTAVANKTATPEQNAALAQYMRAASLFGTPKPPLPIPASGVSAATTALPKPVTPISRTPMVTVPSPSMSPPRSASTQSAPIPPVPKSNPHAHAPLPSPAPQRFLATPVTRIPPPTGNLNPIPLPNVIRAPINTPVTRIPPPSNSSTPITTIPTQPPSTPISTTQSIPGPSFIPVSLTPQIDPMNFVEIGFELTEPGERLLLPRHTILEKFLSPQGGNNVLASFILTIQNDTVYIPITLKLSDCPPRIWESLYKYVYPQQIVVKEMERIMERCKRFDKSVLNLRIPIDEEGFMWDGIKKEHEKKKYQRKKKEVKEEDEETKRRKSLVVGLKYTPTKKENAKLEIVKVGATSKLEVVGLETVDKSESIQKTVVDESGRSETVGIPEVTQQAVAMDEAAAETGLVAKPEATQEIVDKSIV